MAGPVLMLEGSMTWMFPALFAQDKLKLSLPKAPPRRSSADGDARNRLAQAAFLVRLTGCIDEGTHAAGIAR